MARFLPTLTATKLQTATYLLGIALFSISFLVFLNSSISFVVTDVIGQKRRVGDAVGTLGFADELVAIVACPAWGVLSDRIGVRTVAVVGYCIVGVSLFVLVQSSNVYPQLLLGRLAFSIGGAACSTMVTAVLPSMVATRAAHRSPEDVSARDGSIGHCGTPSVSSELTITPTRYSDSSRRGSADADLHDEDSGSASRLAGFVGLFTGAGALVALALFLPLPARFQGIGESPAESVRESFYIVGTVALCVAVGIFFGLRNLAGDEGKGPRALLRLKSSDRETEGKTAPPYWLLVRESIRLGFTDRHIGLGYIGGFVARASSVGISLFIPLFVNAYFVRTGLCTSRPDELGNIKEDCRRAYVLAAALTGIAETAALLGAPLFGYIGGRMVNSKIQWPLLVASVFGVLGYTGFGLLHDPDAFHGGGDSKWALVAVIAIGISQIGAIVCSLAILSRGINDRTVSAPTVGTGSTSEGPETAPLLPNDRGLDGGEQQIERSQLKGTIAGVYSLLGGAGILILTKAGGALFDSWTSGAPFFIMAIFNALLLLATLAVGFLRIGKLVGGADDV